MKYFFTLCSFILFLSGCASSGKIVGNQFIDDTYNIRITFPPGRYSIKPLSKDTKQRVEAVFTSATDNQIVKPTFVMSVYANEQPIDSFVSSMANKHFYEDYYWNYNKELEKDIKVKGYPTRLVYFSSECGGDFPQELLSFSSHNKGITAYIYAAKSDSASNNKIYIIIEYISSEKGYNEREFLQVLENLQFGDIVSHGK